MDNAILQILGTYTEVLKNEFPTTIDFGLLFFPDVENFTDTIEPIDSKQLLQLVNPENKEDCVELNFHTYFDYSSETNSLDKVYSEINRCTINGLKFLKVITSYLVKDDSYDFIVADNNTIKDIIKALKDKKELQINSSLKAPLIDLPTDELYRDIFEFLLNPEFDIFCKQYNIKKKRTFILAGEPGNGKSLSIAWVKSIALQKNISIISYSTAQEFMDSYNDIYDNKNKKIVILEEFDTYAQERTQEQNITLKQIASNPVLNILLNLLDGVNEVTNTVFIFTTNHINSLDSAFIRPGRVDRIIEYKLPTKEQQFKFFVAYLKDYNNVLDELLIYMNTKNVNISYAMMKAITDTIRIKEFWNKQDDKTIQLTIEEIKEIVDQVMSNSNKKEEVKDTKRYVL
jgi:SpoVK/Ycf46/Vps4 family AAA+-type ATPase